MITKLVNGYNVTGNYGATDREYRICNAAGNVVARAGGLGPAIAAANAMSLGDVVPEPEPELILEIEPEPIEEAAPLPPPETLPDHWGTT